MTDVATRPPGAEIRRTRQDDQAKRVILLYVACVLGIAFAAVLMGLLS